MENQKQELPKTSIADIAQSHEANAVGRPWSRKVDRSLVKPGPEEGLAMKPMYDRELRLLEARMDRQMERAHGERPDKHDIAEKLRQRRAAREEAALEAEAAPAPKNNMRRL